MDQALRMDDAERVDNRAEILAPEEQALELSNS